MTFKKITEAIVRAGGVNLFLKGKRIATSDDCAVMPVEIGSSMIIDISDGLSELTAEELLLVVADGNLAGAILCGLRGVVFGGIGEALVGTYAGGPIGPNGVGGMITAGIGGAGAGWFNK